MFKGNNSNNDGINIRARRLKFLLSRLRKSWKIFYKSSYGKAGFYIIAVFIALTILSPVLTFHSPENFVAPTIDRYRPDIITNISIPSATGISASSNFVYASSLSSSEYSFTYLLYEVSPAGNIYGIGYGATTSTPVGKIFSLYNSSVTGKVIYPVTVAPLYCYATLYTNPGVSSTYVLVGSTSGKIFIGEVLWKSGDPGTGVPSMKEMANVSINGTMVYAPVLNSEPASFGVPKWVPFYSYSAYESYLNPAMVYVVVKNTTGYYLNAYEADGLVFSWSVKLPGSQVPSQPYYYGYDSEFPVGKVLIAQGNTIYAFSEITGKEAFNTTLQGNINSKIGISIPIGYQSAEAPSPIGFFSLSNSSNLYYISLNNGSVSEAFHAPGIIQGVTTSRGESGFPSYLFVADTNHVFAITSIMENSSSAGSYNISAAAGSFTSNIEYDPSVDEIYLYTSTHEIISVSISKSGYSLSPNWAAIGTGSTYVTSFSGQFLDTATQSESLLVTTSSNTIEILSGNGIDIAPLPPTLHAPSGNFYLFGTNAGGQSIWSQWIASFPWDWFVGLSVTAGIMLIAVLVATIIGYLGGFTGYALEYLSLAIYLIPGLPLLIVLASVLGPTLYNIVLILTIVGWPFTAFTLIGIARSLKVRSFVEYSRTSGAGVLHILRKHMLPNMLPLVAYFTAVSIGGAVAGISTLQFLGLAPTNIPTWGAMLSSLESNFFEATTAPWIIIPPAVTLTLFILCLIFVSRGLDEVVNPRLRRR